MTSLSYSSVMPCTEAELFEFHLDAANLPAISPPFPRLRLLTPTKRSEIGDVQLIEARFGVWTSTWEATVTRIVQDRVVEDRQGRGPFRRWRHQHRIEPTAGGARLTDAVAFRLLPTAVGEFLEYLFVRPALLAMFAYRHRKTREALQHHKSG